MRDTYGNTNTELYSLAQEAIGLHYEAPEARIILDRADWSHHWPVVDGDGRLTGDVVETEDCGGYWNVDDEAMIANEDLSPAQRKRRNQPSEGYVTL
jgi:hypothetical protein